MPSTDSRDQILYKYLSADVANTVLTAQTLRWSSPPGFNDPHDMQFSFQSQIDREQVVSIALNQMWETYSIGSTAPSFNRLHHMLLVQRVLQPGLSRAEFIHQMSEPLDQGGSSHERIIADLSLELRTFVQNFKILCLSSTRKSTRMWAHYSNSHTGVALGFKSVPELDSPYITARPMRYSTHVPDILSNQELADILSGRQSLNHEAILNRYIYTKSSDWEYEHEWRICSGVGRNSERSFEDIPFHQRELAEVILGLNISADDRAGIIATTTNLYPSANILVVNRAASGFDLELSQLNGPSH